MRADKFEYSYTGSLPSNPFASGFSFTYDSPTLLTGITTLTPSASNCSVSGDAAPVCTKVILVPQLYQVIIDYNIFPSRGGTASLELRDGGDNHMFSLGTHSTGDGTLTITELPDPVATPEPSSIMLMGTGLLSLVGVARRRFSA